MLRFTVDEDFVKSTQEASFVLTVWRGGSKDGCFLEVMAQAMAGRRRLILLSEGREGQGWSRFSGELKSKVDKMYTGNP